MRISDWSSDVCSSDLLRSDYTAQGPTVNLAARIEQLCEPGRVYVSHATAQLLEGYCRLRALGGAQLAGHDQPQEVFELEDAGVNPERLHRTLARSGRSDEQQSELQSPLRTSYAVLRFKPHTTTN